MTAAGYHSQAVIVSTERSESCRQSNTKRARKAWRDVRVALRVDVVPRVEQVLDIYLQTHALCQREECRGIRTDVARQGHGIVDRCIHVGPIEDAQPRTHFGQDLVVVHKENV